MNSEFLMALLVENHGSCKFDRSELHFNGVSCPPELLMHLGWYSLSTPAMPLIIGYYCSC